MKKEKLVLSILILLFCFKISSGQEKFQKLIGTSNNREIGYSVLQKANNNYIIGGIEPSSNSGNFFISELNPSGNIIWKKKYSAIGIPNNAKLKIDYNENLLFVGYSYTQTSSSFISHQFLIKTDNLGNLIWAKEYSDLIILDIVIGKNNDVFMTGRSGTYITSFYTVLTKIDSLGNEIWSQKISNPENHIFANNLLLTNNNNIILSATIKDTIISPLTISHPLIVKFDSLGNMQSAYQYESGYSNYIGQIAELDSNNLILAISSSQWTPETYYGFPTILKLDQNGDIKQSNSTYQIIASDLKIAISNKKEILLTGRGFNMNSNTGDGADCFIIKVDSTLAEKTCKVYLYSSLSGYGATELVHSISNTNDNGFVLCGMLDPTNISNNSTDIFLIKTDSLLNSGCNQYPKPTYDTVFNFTKTPAVLIQNSISINSSNYNTIINSSNNFSINTICETVSIEENTNEINSISIYPNPAKSEISIAYKPKNKNTSIEIYNSIGQLIKSINNITENQQLNISELNNGMYILKLNDGKNSATQRFVKQ